MALRAFREILSTLWTCWKCTASEWSKATQQNRVWYMHPEKHEGLHAQWFRWVTWTQPLPAVTIACCSTHQIRRTHPRKGCRSRLWQVTEWQQKYSEASTEQPGKEEWNRTEIVVALSNHNVSGKWAFQTCMVYEPCLVQRRFIKVSEPLLNPALSSLLQYPHRHSEMRLHDSAGSSFKNSSRDVTISQFKHMQCLKNKRFLFGMQGLFKIQKHCYSHLFWVCPLPYPHPCSETFLPFFAASGKTLYLWLMGQKHLTPPTWG